MAPPREEALRSSICKDAKPRTSPETDPRPATLANPKTDDWSHAGSPPGPILDRIGPRKRRPRDLSAFVDPCDPRAQKRSVGLVPGQDDGEGRPFPDLRNDLDLAAVGRDDAPAQGQAQRRGVGSRPRAVDRV